MNNFLVAIRYYKNSTKFFTHNFAGFFGGAKGGCWSMLSCLSLVHLSWGWGPKPPPLSGRASRAPGAAQTFEIEDVRSFKNHPDIDLTRYPRDNETL